jgi:hypothetical protein
MTNHLYRVLLAAFVLATLLFAVACPAGKTIAEINRDPMRYSQHEVGIRGTVVNSWGALGTGMFEIDDGTGKMWVLSSSYGVPSKGMRIGVAGTIMPTFSLGGRSFMSVMRDTHRRHDTGS